jgi:copper chaperone CopZ
MVTRTFRVAEIHCGSCENTIKASLSRLPGVAAVLPSAERNDVRVSFDDSQVTEEQLRHVLRGIGFEPVAEDGVGTRHVPPGETDAHW